MKLSEIVEKLDLKVVAGANNLNSDVKRGYVSDLLSDVIANSKEGDIWITLQVHQNIVGVASLKELAGIVLVNDRYPEEETIRKAEAEGIPIAVSTLPSFEIVGRLYNFGILGVSDDGGV